VEVEAEGDIRVDNVRTLQLTVWKLSLKYYKHNVSRKGGQKLQE